jgi:hypothetical protein
LRGRDREGGDTTDDSPCYLPPSRRRASAPSTSPSRGEVKIMGLNEKKEIKRAVDLPLKGEVTTQ